MIRLTTKSDLKNLEKNNIHPLIKRYLTDYLEQMLMRFNTDNISKYGSIVFLFTWTQATRRKFSTDDGTSPADITEKRL